VLVALQIEQRWRSRRSSSSVCDRGDRYLSTGVFPGMSFRDHVLHELRRRRLAPIAVEEDGGAKTRLRCAACGWTHWNNPTPGARLR
jgi:hypothetical protein